MQKNALVLSTQHHFISRFESLLQNAGYEVYIAANEMEMCTRLEERNSYHIAVLDYDSFDPLSKVPKIREKNAEAALIVMASQANLPVMMKQFGNSPQLIKVCDEIPDIVLNHHFRRLDKISNRISNNNTQLCPMPALWLGKSEIAPCDIYIKLSDQKFLKIQHKNDRMDARNLEKYMARENSLLFVKMSDYANITSIMSEKLIHQLKKTTFDPHRWTLLAQFGQQCSLELISRMGITEKTLDLVENTLISLEKIITSNVSLSSIYESLSKDSYSTSHSIALSVLLAQMTQVCGKIQDQSFVEKFTFAAIFHDMDLTEDDLCKIDSKNSREFSLLSSRQKDKILQHPLRAVIKLQNVKGIPADVDKIIEQHHETPVGDGFPRELNHLHIHYLASFFIVAHHFIDLLMDGGNNPQHLHAVLLELKSQYYQGNFLDAMNALEAIILPELLHVK